MATKPAAIVNAWEDDPATGVIISRPAPEIGKLPLGFKFPKPAPKAGAYKAGTPEFRYWTAAEALRRGADFWAKLCPLTEWEVGKTLSVILDEGEDLNAYYDRAALNFFHGPFGSTTVYSGESPDVICHEMGHAILDTLRPDLWNAASHETAAFHESFADISAILSAIQLPSLRKAVIDETGGKLAKNSRLSRLAEQLGAAIRLQSPDAVDKDCLRNAANSFTYQDPTNLPSSAPATQLSSEAHSFSRVFTGAFFEALGSMVAVKAKKGGSPTSDELANVASNLATILVGAVKVAPIATDWYSQVAAHMVIVAAGVDKAYPPILKATFVRRSILSLHAVSTLPAPKTTLSAGMMVPLKDGLSTIAIPAAHYGLSESILVESASQPRKFSLASAGPGSTSHETPSSASAAQAFVDDLFRRGRVDYGALKNEDTYLDQGSHLKSHRLVRAAGAVRLERKLFDCGCRFCS
jgi:hypothetical protein